MASSARRSSGPTSTFERIALDDTSWVDVARGWIADPEPLYRNLLEHGSWRQGQNFRYEKMVAEPRLGGRWPSDPETEAVRLELFLALRDRYQVGFDRGGLVQYRDGRDSVGFHRDREMKWLDDTVIAILTLGAQRPWHLRPRTGRYEDLDEPDRGATHDLAPASGDLVVIGGRCQADWLHAVPKVTAPIGPAHLGAVALDLTPRPARGGPQLRRRPVLLVLTGAVLRPRPRVRVPQVRSR